MTSNFHSIPQTHIPTHTAFIFAYHGRKEGAKDGAGTCEQSEESAALLNSQQYEESAAQPTEDLLPIEQSEGTPRSLRNLLPN